jgi:3-polyprenyl-4-hydroxybenzoate decarboxylase
MSYSDLRQFLRLLEHKGELRRVAEPIDPELESWPELGQLAHVAPRMLPNAALEHTVLEGEDVNLGLLPIQRCR